MRAISVASPCDATQLVVTELPSPEVGPEQISISVYATALNRADLLQRRGKYPPPPGESNILGLECAGVVDRVGGSVTAVKPGDRVMALLGSGGYAERVVVHEALAMPVPKHLSLIEAAAIPEAFLTAREALFTLGRLGPEEHALIHAAAGGVGSAAVQLAKACGARVFATASTGKLERVRQLGADEVIDYREQSFAEVIAERTERQGVDVVVDFIGSTYFESHMKCLKTAGRLVVVGVMGGPAVALNLGTLLFKRLQILGLVMRSRRLSEKIAITASFVKDSLPLFEQGLLKPVVDTVFDFDDAGRAHERMERNENVGKILLRLREE